MVLELLGRSVELVQRRGSNKAKGELYLGIEWILEDGTEVLAVKLIVCSDVDCSFCVQLTANPRLECTQVLHRTPTSQKDC